MGRLDRSPRANWVEKRGGLPDYIDRIAVHLHDGGAPIGTAIATAINAAKKMCSTGDLNWPGLQHVNPGSRAEACAAVSQWEAMKTAHEGDDVLALASDHRFRHGWIPLDGSSSDNRAALMEKLKEYTHQPVAKAPGSAKAPEKVVGKASAPAAKSVSARPATAAAPATNTTNAMYAARSKAVTVNGRRALALALDGDGTVRADGNTTTDLKARGYLVSDGAKARLTPAGRAAAEALKAGKAIPDRIEPTATKNARTAGTRTALNRQAITDLGGPAAAKKLRDADPSTVPAHLQKAFRRVDVMTDAEFRQAIATAHMVRDALALASWNAMLHPRVPAGQAGGGKFAKGQGGGKGGAGKGAKGGKGGAAAAAAAQAKVILPQFMAMNPQQRAEFLAKLSDPQLKALLHAASQGNSNDPATRAALTAIKDQVAARSLTGAKGPTAINAGKAAAAAKSAASKQASAAKKTSTAAASAAKKQTTAQNAAAKKQLASAKTAATAAAKAQKSAVANQAASLKAQAAMKAPTQAAKVAGLTSALKSTTNPAQQQQILAQLKTALGLAQTARLAEVLALAFPNAGSGDGPATTVNGTLKTPAHIKAAVKAHGKVPPGLQPGYRKKVIGAAKKMGALRNVPPAWLTGKGM